MPIRTCQITSPIIGKNEEKRGFLFRIFIFLKIETTLPNATNAFIDDTKFTEYCLNEDHPVGKHKARIFKSNLDIGIENFGILKSSILKGVLDCPANIIKETSYGILYNVNIPIVGPNQKEAIVKTAWIIRKEENFPRLTTCYVL